MRQTSPILTVISMFFAACGPSPTPSTTSWYATDARRATLRFETQVTMALPDGFEGPASRLLEPQWKPAVDAVVERQLQHLFGAFTEHPAFVDTPGVPSGKWRVTLTAAAKVPNEPRARVTYAFEDVAVFHKGVMAGGQRTISFVLPADPVGVYARGIPPHGRKNRCTDEHYNSEDDFWYFRNPYMDGCPLTAADLVKVTGTLAPLNSTRGTYPDYRQLRGDNGNGRDFAISYVVGIDESFRQGDLGRGVFEDAFAGLQRAGFRVTVDEARRKRLLRDGDGFRAAIEMSLVDPASTKFVDLATSGLTKADVFLYDGHSGLGGYVSVERLSDRLGRPLALPKDKSQIYWFHGCSTYAYYNADYFALKADAGDPRGSKNLDIVTTGIGAAFDIGAAADVSFLTGLTGPQKPSWQELIDGIHAVDPELSPLTAVNGDEDDPRAP